MKLTKLVDRIVLIVYGLKTLDKASKIDNISSSKISPVQPQK
jgi:hypothetical protein